jgi:hypothetical protein
MIINFTRTFDLGDSYGHTFIIMRFIFSYVIYTILSTFFILILCGGVEITI